MVTGSEIVGMVPYPALLQTGLYYLKAQGRSTGIPVSDILNTAVQSLGLKDVADFNIKERVLGLPDDINMPLINITVTDFVDEVSSESPAPGGGSIAALAGALGASLSSMVSNLTANNRGSEDVDEILNQAAVEAQEVKQFLVYAIDADTNAFNAYMEARRLPAKTDEEKRQKFEAEQQGLKVAVDVPMKTALNSFKALEIAEIVVQHGKPASITDVGVGAQMAYSGVLGGIYNVLINLGDIKDVTFNERMRKDCADLKSRALKKLNLVLDRVEKKIQKL